MSVRVGSATTFVDSAAFEAMQAGFEWATRGCWLQMARDVSGPARARRIRNAIEAHRKMMAHIRAAKKAGAK